MVPQIDTSGPVIEAHNGAFIFHPSMGVSFISAPYYTPVAIRTSGGETLLKHGPPNRRPRRHHSHPSVREPNHLNNRGINGTSPRRPFKSFKDLLLRMVRKADSTIRGNGDHMASTTTAEFVPTAPTHEDVEPRPRTAIVNPEPSLGTGRLEPPLQLGASSRVIIATMSSPRKLSSWNSDGTRCAAATIRDEYPEPQRCARLPGKGDGLPPTRCLYNCLVVGRRVLEHVAAHVRGRFGLSEGDLLQKVVERIPAGEVLLIPRVEGQRIPGAGGNDHNPSAYAGMMQYWYRTIPAPTRSGRAERNLYGVHLDATVDI